MAPRIPSGAISGAALRRSGNSMASGSGSQGGFNGNFFPPLNPLPPMAPDDVRGRKFDYPTGVNLIYQPRSQGQNLLSFEILRRFAEPSQGGLDIVRLLIERRKNQMKAQTLSIVGVAKDDDGGDRARAFESLLKYPDGRNTWRSFLNAILEDHFVVDAVAIFPTLATLAPWGRRPIFKPIDGATINLLIDTSGDTPTPPLPAYQQVLKGLPADDYTTDQLGYYVGNPRTQKMYGMSPVEQMVGIIQIALNRQLSVLEYFTSGTVPDLLVGVPKEWSTNQIATFQQWFDSVLSGQLGERRKARFYPGDMKPYETKTNITDPAIDEWLTRVACFAFGVSPQGFIKEMNRATSETAKQTSMEENLEPTKLFVLDLVNDLLHRCGADDLEAKWKDEEIQDPMEKATVAVMLRGGATGTALPIITLDEQRELLALPPATAAQRAELEPPEPVDTGAVDPASTNSNEPPGNTSAAKRRGGRLLPPLSKNTALARRTERGIRALATRMLTAQKDALVTTLRAHGSETAKAAKALGEDEITALIQELQKHPWDDAARRKLRQLLEKYSTERATAALDQVADYVPGTDAAYAALLRQANADAVAWATARVGNLITDVSDTTRDIVNELSAVAVRDGLTNNELADQIESAFGFSAERSIMIARTETANADSNGSMIGYRQSGVVMGKAWDPDEGACPICLANAAQGTIGLDEDFDSGDDAPPAHPNCECSVIPVVDEDAAGIVTESSAEIAA